MTVIGMMNEYFVFCFAQQPLENWLKGVGIGGKMQIKT